MFHITGERRQEEGVNLFGIQSKPTGYASIVFPVKWRKYKTALESGISHKKESCSSCCTKLFAAL